MIFDLVTATSAAIGAGLAAVATEVVAAWVRTGQGAEKHRDDDLAELLECVKELGTLADAYWPKSAADLGEEETTLRSHIGARLHHVSLIYSEMFTGDLKRDCDIAYTPLMKAVAGGTFGDADRPAEPERLVLVHQLALSFRRKTIRCRRGLRRPTLA